MIEPILKYYDLSQNVTAFSTTRHGGFSTGPYASFNINEYCGDTPQHIQQNKEILCRKLAIKPSALVLPHQVHGVHVLPVYDSFFSLQPESRKLALEDTDALITAERQICIGVSTADCVPILLYDPRNHAAAAVHAGWRGTVQHIAEHVVAMLHRCFHSVPSELLAVIGPSISMRSFEVGDEVYQAFADAHFPMERIAQSLSGKWHIDLWQANAESLSLAGLPLSNISYSGICTYEHSDDYFSARKLTINSGRIFSGIILR